MSPTITTTAILIIVLIVLVRANRAPDFVIWGGVVLLLVAPVQSGAHGAWRIGVLSASQALSGLANEGVVTIAALFIVAAGLRDTGALQTFVRPVLGSPKSLRAAQSRIMWSTALMSGFLNNTPLVAMMLPVTDGWAKRLGYSVSKLLMPLSFASILGGACTLIGTSTNLVVNGWLIEQTGHAGLGMFEVTPVALPIATAGILFILLGNRWLLPERKPAFRESTDAREYVVEMIIEDGSELDGKTIEAAHLRGLPGLFLIEIDRDGEILPAVAASVQLHTGDRLVFTGVVDSVVDLQKIPGLRPATDQVFKLDEARINRVLIEAVVSNTCPLVGRTIKEGRFRTAYNAAVIAVARNGQRIKKKIGDIRLQAGDNLLLETRPSFHEQQRNRRDFYLTSQVEGSTPLNRERSPLAIAILAGVVISVSVGLLSMLQASLIAAAAMIVTRCCSASVARRAIDWEVLLVIAGAIALGKAMDVSGLAGLLGHQIRELFGSNPTLMLAAVYGLAMVMANLVTAKAGALLMLPIAYTAAHDLQVSFLPYVIAVMIASATTVATPIGYPTNLMVYGPGGYRFTDYLRLGAPLSALTWILAVLLIPTAWPF